MKLLLEHGADVSMKNKDGCTAMMYPSESGNPETIPTLLSHGADINELAPIKNFDSYNFLVAKLAYKISFGYSKICPDKRRYAYS